MSDKPSCTSSTSFMSRFWPDLFSRNRQLGPSIPTAQQQTTITQYHVSNQMFPLPCVSECGKKRGEVMPDVGNVDTDMMDVDSIMDELFDFDKYVSEAEKEVAEVHPRDSASNCLTANVPAKNAARGTVSEAKVVQATRNTVKTLQPFEQLKQHEGLICEVYNVQQRERTKKWLDGIPLYYLPSIEWAC